MAGEKYNLIGIIESQYVYASFVRPVFKHNNKYYFQYGKNGIIYNFKEIPKELKDRIVLLTQINISTNTNLKKEYFIGDNPVIALRLDLKNYFISDIDNFMIFIKDYQTEDELLKEEIDMLRSCVKEKNNKRKILKH